MPYIYDEDMPIILGNCIRVLNADSTKEEHDSFVCIQVESEDGRTEYPILMTLLEYDKLEHVVNDDMKKMVAGRIYPAFIHGKNYYCVKLNGYDKEEYIGIFDIGDWAKYYRRAVEHPKSVTKKSLLTDIFD